MEDRRSFLQSLGAAVPAMAVVALPGSNSKHKFSIGEQFRSKNFKDNLYKIVALLTDQTAVCSVFAYRLRPLNCDYTIVVEEADMCKYLDKVS